MWKKLTVFSDCITWLYTIRYICMQQQVVILEELCIQVMWVMWVILVFVRICTHKFLVGEGEAPKFEWERFSFPLTEISPAYDAQHILF